jgi:bacterioferritin
MGSDKVIKILQQAQERELLATVVYADQHYCLENLGLDALAKEMEEISIQEMKHHEAFAERILFLEGSPSRKIAPGAKYEEKDVKAMLKIDIALEEGAIQLYNEAIKICSQEGDDGTRHLFSEILRQEEEHLDKFKKKLELLERFGDLYLIQKCM